MLMYLLHSLHNVTFDASNTHGLFRPHSCSYPTDSRCWRKRDQPRHSSFTLPHHVLASRKLFHCTFLPPKKPPDKLSRTLGFVDVR